MFPEPYCWHPTCSRLAGGCELPSRPGRHSTSSPTASALAAAATATARAASSATQ